MSDLFHKAVPVDCILKTFDVMRRADWHHFQVLAAGLPRHIFNDFKTDGGVKPTLHPHS